MLLQLLQRAEAEEADEKANFEFQQRVIAGSYGPHDPKLYWKIFDPDDMPDEEGGNIMDGNILQPTSVEEFEAMLNEWDEAGAMEAMEAIQMFQPSEQLTPDPTQDPFAGQFPYNIAEVDQT